MKDVAAAAGVDASLVSRLLSGDESLSVRPETEQRVMDAVQRLGYRRNPAARALKTARTMALGLIIPTSGTSSTSRSPSAPRIGRPRPATCC